MKPLKKNIKSPRGSGVDSKRDQARMHASKLSIDADIKLSLAASTLRDIGENNLADTARRLRREVNALTARIDNINVMLKKSESED